MSVYESLKKARRVSTPIVSVDTVDPAATLAELADKASGNGTPPPPIVQWDGAAGLRPLNDPGRDAIAAALQPGGGIDNTKGNPFEAIAGIAPHFPPGTIFAIHAAGRWIDGNVLLMQAIRNLRDAFKSDRRTLLLLGQDMALPAELTGDVLGFDDPLPGPAELAAIVAAVFSDAGLPEPSQAVTDPAVDATRGLSAFAAEQAVALCLTADGLDLAALWVRKCRAIDSTPGLSVFQDVETFDDLAGVEHVKTFLRGIMNGNRKPGAVVIIDEIDKAMVGSDPNSGGGDSSGVSADQLGYLLQYLNDTGSPGLLEVGPAGTCKSAIAKAAAACSGVPCLALDLGAMKGSLVGQSEAQIRAAFRVITAVSNGTPLFIGTANSLGTLPAPLRRRFTLGTWYFDLPDATERAGIWPVHLARFGLDAAADLPDDSGWTGAEIRACCDVADRLGIDPAAAGGYITPVCKADPEGVERLRRSASGRYRSASYAGAYRMPDTTKAADTGRRIDVKG